MCTECASGAKKSFMGYKILGRHEVEPVLKNAAPMKADIAVSKPLTWVMKPKKEVPRTEQTVPIKISAPKAKVPVRPQNQKLPKVLEKPKDKKVPERPKVQKKEKRTKTPSPERAQNNRNAANPRPGSVQQTVD